MQKYSELLSGREFSLLSVIVETAGTVLQVFPFDFDNGCVSFPEEGNGHFVGVNVSILGHTAEGATIPLASIEGVVMASEPNMDGYSFSDRCDLVSDTISYLGQALSDNSGRLKMDYTASRNKDFFMLESIYVRAEYRRRGLGQALLRSLPGIIKNSLARQIAGVALYCGLDGEDELRERELIKFFAKCGFKRVPVDELCLYKRIRQEDNLLLGAWN